PSTTARRLVTSTTEGWCGFSTSRTSRLMSVNGKRPCARKRRPTHWSNGLKGFRKGRSALHHTDGPHADDLARNADGRHDVNDHRDVLVGKRGLLGEDALGLAAAVNAHRVEVLDDLARVELARGSRAAADAARAVAGRAEGLLHRAVRPHEQVGGAPHVAGDQHGLAYGGEGVG